MADQSPPYGARVLFYSAVDDLFCVGDWRDDGQFWCEGGRPVHASRVSHWQPLESPVVSAEDRALFERMAATAWTDVKTDVVVKDASVKPDDDE
jgi:hypothetical protein